MNMDNPDLSIVIVNFNTSELTRQCLRSIRDNAAKLRYEVWVVDNNSEDDSVDMIGREFPEAGIICNETNRGLADATNQGLKKCSGRYAVALNSDTVILSGAFDTLVRFMDDHPDAGGATPKLILPNGDRHPGFIGNVPNLKSELLEILAITGKKYTDLLQVERFSGWENLNSACEVPCILWGTCFIVRQEILETVGLQDPEFFVYGEDWDWSVRIRINGWKLYYVPEAEVIHYGGQSTKQAPGRMFAQMWKSKCRFLRKHYGGATAVAARLALVLVCGARICKWSLFRLARPKDREKADQRIGLAWTIIRAVVAD